MRRALIGYSPAAVRAVLQAIERHYRERQEAIKHEGGASGMTPSTRSLPLTLFGYRKTAVRAAIAELHAYWQAELGRLTAVVRKPVVDGHLDHFRAVAGPDVVVESTTTLTALTIEASQSTPPALAAASNLRVVPMRRRTPATDDARAPDPSLRSAALRPWRPGAIEELDDLGPVGGTAAPALSTPDRVGAAVRIRTVRPGASEWRPPPAPARPSALISATVAQPAAQTVTPPTPQTTVTPYAAPAAPPTAQPAAQFEAQVVQGLSERLDTLFQRFLVGKVLGADLVLPSGQLLGAKHSVITRELVERAQEAGLLPLLIASMTLPGIGAQ